MKDERGKENVPPLDDISQTRTQISDPTNQIESSMSALKAAARASRRRKEIDDGAIDVDRSALGELSAEDFYAEGCDGSSVFLIPAEEEGRDQEGGEEEKAPIAFDVMADVKGKGKEIDIDIDELMRKDDFEMSKKAALLEPIEKAEDGFEVWESGSSKGDE